GARALRRTKAPKASSRGPSGAARPRSTIPQFFSRHAFFADGSLPWSATCEAYETRLEAVVGTTLLPSHGDGRAVGGHRHRRRGDVVAELGDQLDVLLHR